jgi:hypothetical protein
MAIEYEICETRKRSWNVKDASSGVILRTKMEASLEYVVVAKNFGQNETPADISDSTVCQLASLPKVNGTSFVDPVDSTVRPFMLCKSKSCRRHDNAPHIFTVTAKFEEVVDGRENPGQGCPTDPTDITPQVSYQILKEERVIYTDLLGENCHTIPGVHEPFEAPVVQPVPNLMITVTQYEPYISAQDMLDRSFVCNNDTYRGKAQDHWMIGQVSAKEVEVESCSGTQAWAQVTYPITLSDFIVQNYVPGGGQNGLPTTEMFVGHQSALPLISNYHLDGGEKVRFADVGTGYGSIGFVDEDGIALPSQDRPNYMLFRNVPRINFASFLQV